MSETDKFKKKVVWNLLKKGKKEVPSEGLLWSPVHDSAATATSTYGPGTERDLASNDIGGFSNQIPLIVSRYLLQIRSHPVPQYFDWSLKYVNFFRKYLKKNFRNILNT